ncbi:MAG: hypothetical protein HC778_00930 [Chamaesiphon sp. CSU_1_12]|nr:hypothetical protein [Chamaesiphon sp. CSU_1_12]
MWVPPGLGMGGQSMGLLCLKPPRSASGKNRLFPFYTQVNLKTEPPTLCTLPYILKSES